uniref:Uncharacterized protein n=1 Tax=Oryza brachyantha TaxID=4533 RepID=J3MFW4_ORYBR
MEFPIDHQFIILRKLAFIRKLQSSSSWQLKSLMQNMDLHDPPLVRSSVLTPRIVQTWGSLEKPQLFSISLSVNPRGAMVKCLFKFTNCKGV